MTVRDREVVAWVGRQRIVTASLLRERFGMGRAATYARLAALVDRRLLAHLRVFHGVPGVYMATRTGLKMVGSLLPPARVDIRTYAHDVDAAALCVELEREFGADRVVTERELRAADTGSPQPSFSARLGGGQHGGRLHYPDLAVKGFDGERPLAVELERTPKRRARLEAIARAYVAARHIAGVRYYTTSPAVEPALDAAFAVVRAPAGLFELRRRASFPLDSSGVA